MKVLGPAHVLLTSATLALGCGSRTTLKWEEGPPPPPECLLDKDCEGFGDRCFPVACVEGKCEATPPVDCNDRNPCTSDVCDPNTGACAHPLATLDLDGDEHRSPLPGKRAGDPDSCGDDCDDTNPKALPGGAEICDGVDNDCNGIVDDRATLAPAGDAIKISDGTTRASPGSLAYAGGASFLGAYSGQVAKRDSVYLANLSPLVGRVGKANRFTTSPADAYGGPLAWTGDRFGIAWTDRRDARGSTINYEVYFNLVNPDGTKRTADVRLTHADYFSINVSMAWTGNQFVVVWQDDGLTKHDDNGIFAQRVDVNGAAIGGNVRLHEDDGRGQTAPAIAAGPRSLGVAWMHGDSQSHELVFAAFDYELAPLVKPVSLTGPMSPGVAATVYFNEDRFVILWYDPDGPNKTIFGAVRSEKGEELVAPKPIVATPRHARYPTLVPYGDRALLVWSDDRDNNLGYELYAKTIDQKLQQLSPDSRLTRAVGDSIDPIASLGPSGSVGIMFGDDRDGTGQVYFTRLECVAPLTK